MLCDRCLRWATSAGRRAEPLRLQVAHLYCDELHDCACDVDGAVCIEHAPVRETRRYERAGVGGWVELCLDCAGAHRAELARTIGDPMQGRCAWHPRATRLRSKPRRPESFQPRRLPGDDYRWEGPRWGPTREPGWK